MAQIIDGKKIAEKIKDKIVGQVQALGGDRPNLAIVLAGKREDSELYVRLKEKQAKTVGIDTHLYRCEEDVSQEEIIQTIEYLNQDSLIDAILVQLPLPKGMDANRVIKAIDPEKDVDRFHPKNLNKLMQSCRHEDVMPPVHEVVLEIVKNIEFSPKNKDVCILANSEIFGKSLAKVLECRGAKAIMAKMKDPTLKQKTKKADLLITALGKPLFIKKEMIKQDAVLIDVGITKEGKKVLGDVDFEDCKDKASFITPVPGGVGPITIAMLFKNTLELYYKHRK